MTVSIVVRKLLLGGFVAALGGCAGADSLTLPGPAPIASGSSINALSPTVFGAPLTPSSVRHLYVTTSVGIPGGTAITGALESYHLPLTSSSIPDVSIDLPVADGYSLFAVAPDGEIALYFNNRVSVFHAPLAPQSIALDIGQSPATFTSVDPAVGLAYDSRNRLWLARAGGTLERFPAGLSGTSLPDLVLNAGFGVPGFTKVTGIAVGRDDLVVVSASTGTSASTLLEYPAPYRLVPTVIFPANVAITDPFVLDSDGSVYAPRAYYQGPLFTPLSPNGGTNGPPPPPLPIAPSIVGPFQGIGRNLAPNGDVFAPAGSQISGYHRPFLPTDNAFVSFTCVPAPCTVAGLEFGP